MVMSAKVILQLALFGTALSYLKTDDSSIPQACLMVCAGKSPKGNIKALKKISKM